MIKRFIPIFLGFSLMFGLGVNSNINHIHKEVIETKAADETAYKTALFGSSYNSGKIQNYTSTWTSTNNGFTVTIVNGNNNQNNWNSVKFGSKSDPSIGSITTKSSIDKAIGSISITIDSITNSSVNSITLYTSSNGSNYTSAGTFTAEKGTQSVNINSPQEKLYYQIKIDCQKGSANGLVEISKIEYFEYIASTDPSVTLSSDSSSTLNIFKGDTGNVKFLVKNIADVTKDSWSFTFSEGQDNISLEGSTLDTNNVGTVSITASTIGTSKFTVSVAGTSCETIITVNVVAKPASITIVNKTIKEGNILEIATGDSKTVSFSGKDTDGIDYEIKAADVTAEVTSGSSFISLGGTTKIYGNKIGGGVVTFTLNALPSITAKLTINVFDDYALSVKKDLIRG